MDKQLSYHDLNASLNLYGPDGELQFGKDKEAVRQYFLQHVNTNTVFFHDLAEKLDYLIENKYYKPEILEMYSFAFVKRVFKAAYAHKFRFKTFLGAYKFYTAYALKTDDGQRFLERYEDRVAVVSLFLADGDKDLALSLVDEIISGRYQPATPTFNNAGKLRSGEQVSCFLLRTEDNLESISQTIASAMQLSKRGGGVGILLTNIREKGASIKGVEGIGSGVIPYMKVLEDSFSWINQLGQRSGAGAVYINVHHPDIMGVLDTKRENADEKIRIKTLSIGVIVPDITFELAKRNEDMYLFSPSDVEKHYGVPMSDISISDEYYSMVDNPDIKKSKISARELFQTLAEIQFESGYPYIMFEDTVNRVNPIDGRITMSNLCSEILQINTPSTFKADGSFDTIGRDISCNLGSLNIALAVDSPDLGKTINTAVRALTNVSVQSNIESVPSVANGNNQGHSIGLGQMNLHGFFGREHMYYGDEDSLDFTSAYFAIVAYHAIKASNEIAAERGETFQDFSKSTYADGSYFDKYVSKSWEPKTEKVKAIFKERGVFVPTTADWANLRDDVIQHGMFNMYLQAVPPTGSISYINNSTSSIHPIVAPIEIRKEGKIGRVYYPAPHLTEENIQYFESAYEIGPEKIIDVYAAAQEHIDQGMSLTLFFKDTATTRDLNKAYIYAWRKGIKTLYYIRLRQAALEGTAVEGCVSCAL